MKKILSRLAPFLPIILAFLAALPLFGARFIPTHDGEYHLIRFWQFSKMLSSGVWFPRWAPDLNNGFGIPLFTFNYPFPNYVGSFFHFAGLSFVDSVKWTLASGYLLACLFCYLWLRTLYGKTCAIVGTISAAFVPYWFVDIYVRGSVGEVWAIAMAFIALWSIERGKRLITVLSVAALIVSHNILALLFVPTLALYAFLKEKRRLLDMLLGLGASSYFWWPALTEQQYIRGLSPVNIFDYFPEIWQLIIPTWGTGFRGNIGGGTEMSYQIGVIPLFVLFIFFLRLVTKKGKPNRVPLFFAGIFVASALLMLPWSAPLWRTVPLSHFVQYPWRLLSFVIVSVPVLAADMAKQFRWGWAIAVFAVLFAYGYARPVTYEPRTDAYYLAQESFTRGTSSLGNSFQTVWITEDPLSLPRDLLLEEGSVHSEKVRPTYYKLTLMSSHSEVVHMPIAFYPGWKVKLDGKEQPTMPDGNGMLSFEVPQGSHTGEVWLGLTRGQMAATGMSVFALFIVSASFILKKRL